MGYDRKYGVVATERGDIPPDEPLFVIRGKDAAAPDAIDAYAEHAAQYGADPETVAICRERAEQVRAWQATHPRLVKRPDTRRDQVRGASAPSPEAGE